MRDVTEFKDKLIELYGSKNYDQMFDLGPIYFLGMDGEIFTGQFPGADDAFSFMDRVRKLTRGSDYVAVAMLSMIADLNKTDDPDGLAEYLNKLPREKMLSYLNENNLVTKSVSIRVESRHDSDENSLMNIALANTDFSDCIEVFDHEAKEEVQQGPFQKSLFDED